MNNTVFLGEFMNLKIKTIILGATQLLLAGSTLSISANVECQSVTLLLVKHVGIVYSAQAVIQKRHTITPIVPAEIAELPAYLVRVPLSLIRMAGALEVFLADGLSEQETVLLRQNIAQAVFAVGKVLDTVAVSLESTDSAQIETLYQEIRVLALNSPTYEEFLARIADNQQSELSQFLFPLIQLASKPGEIAS